MGQIISQIASEKGHEIVKCINEPDFLTKDLPECDLIIEFTEPHATINNILKLAALQKPIVIGTTGWDKELPKLKKIVSKHNLSVLYGSNFSLGVNLFKEILVYAAKLLSEFEQYDLALLEQHHKEKKDSPSGTAVNICEKISEAIPGSSVSTAAVRCGHIFGKHELIFDSQDDTISIKHEAKGRRAFANGAILAGIWLQNKKGLFSFTECLDDILNNSESRRKCLNEI